MLKVAGPAHAILFLQLVPNSNRDDDDMYPRKYERPGRQKQGLCATFMLKRGKQSHIDSARRLVQEVIVTEMMSRAYGVDVCN